MKLTKKIALLLLCAGLYIAACQKSQDGLPGSQILRGTGVPAASLGIVGDYYLDTSTGILYGPKTENGWESSVDLTGDQGPAGPGGATGPGGPPGPTGPAGPTGTANVIYSGWQYATGFSDSTIDNSALKVGYVKAPSLTATILNSGTVLIYMTYGGGIFPLPYTSNAGGKPNTINFTPMLSKILISRFTHDNSNSVALSTLLQYRYIIIPGSVSGGRMATPPPDYTDYKAVCTYYGIPL
jgi:hypothetical protein